MGANAVRLLCEGGVLNVAAQLDRLYVDGRDFDPASVRANFDELGAVVFKGVLEPRTVAAYAESLRLLAVERLKSLGLSPDREDDLDACGRQLLRRDPALLMELFQIAREIREQYDLLFAPGMMRAVNTVMPTAVVQIVPESCGVRMDAPNQDERGFHWHYDYAYITTSLDGVTGWAPLLPMTADMGWLRVLLGSHRKIHPIDVHDRSSIRGLFLGHHIFSLHGADIETFERDSVDVPDVEPGDLLVIHCCLLHRSGRNRGNRARWTALCRFGNGLDPAVLTRGWRSVRGASGERLFNDLHPDLVHRVRSDIHQSSD